MLFDPERKDEREASVDRLHELIKGDDYAHALDEAQRWWCDEMGMWERGVPFCQRWKAGSMKVEL